MAVYFLIKIMKLLLLLSQETTEGLKIGKLQPILFFLVLIDYFQALCIHSTCSRAPVPERTNILTQGVRSSQNRDE